MRYSVRSTRSYRKSLKKLVKSGSFEISVLEQIVNTLAKGMPPAPKHKDHALTGDMCRLRECHIKSDLLLVYQKDESILVLILINVGSHSELFG
jgi:mRNA interferase YafQ